MSPAARPGRVVSRKVFLARGRPAGRRDHRGVSEIIATIYVVAITVVLAAVLFIEVVGVTHTGASTPFAVGMVFSTQSSGADTYFDFGTLAVTSGLTTSMFGLHVTTPAGLAYGTAAAVPGTCVFGSVNPSPGTCTGISDRWYGILVGGMSHNVTATYSAVGWAYVSGTTDIVLNDSYTLIVITPTSVAGSDYVISAFPTGSASVSGSAFL